MTFAPAFPNASNWLGTAVDLAGCCILMGFSLWVSQGFTNKIWIEVFAAVAGMWVWDWFYSMLRHVIGDPLERRTR